MSSAVMITIEDNDDDPLTFALSTSASSVMEGGGGHDYRDGRQRDGAGRTPRSH